MPDHYVLAPLRRFASSSRFGYVQTSVGISYQYLDTLSAFTANLDVSEYDDSVGDLLSQSFSFAVAN